MSRGLQLALLLLVPLACLACAAGLQLFAAERSAAQGYVVRLELPPVDRARDLPAISGPQDASRPLVVIDPGHGGFDPGAGAGPIKEKDVALAIALALRERLLAGGGIRVAMTRDEDRFVTLSERPGIARQLGADLFVSIHADSAESDAARGASVYILSEKGSSQTAARFAARENRADTVNGVSLSETSDTVGAILLDLSQREAQAGSAIAGNLFLREIRGQVPLHYETVESASLAVLKAPDIPSILFETGYISNAEDAQYLNSPEGRETIADAAAQAIRVYFARQAGT
ncbi:N-acetylmuramoyl-L-alanine amidase [Novosphingobium chloroacetimidivorans]|uniref:N-acetylmuramoyl-L-alanine amidase n=1 Tax=Novosphingobium chloroacetimidivorans TaxID=1428314 RepID=A0A7W7KA61_9SPHN|nr:N-acetylmuramoyl-L-alanine amidase [Novosphingobium chloroacetimidivorans]MBB4858534.1 N-acetylmuramoyl-L-alanine amidase [Novosphingobium chloroacetimidivorans]